MKHTIIKLTTLFFALVIASCSQEKMLIRKASNAVDVYDYDKAISYYDQVLAKDSNSFYANAGKGIVLSEYMGKYDKAIPYLEKASKHPEKASMKINNDLGISYHYIGNYPRALDFYGKAALQNKEDNEDYDYYLSKRIDDCRYALEHPQVASVEEQSYKNVGSVINTDMPEYGPIYKKNELIFTSKRKDTPKEKKNGVDRRYFENMYVSTITNNSYSAPRRYTLPDYGNESNYKRGSESALSISPDGKTLYIFRRGKLYEADLTDSTKGEQKLSRTINSLDFQTYAVISADGKMLLFTSDSQKGRGGTDLYKSIKDENGKWSTPEMLPYNINTDYDEDAPYLAEDGTLFFASNGLAGYGGYDIYKTRYENGTWSTPQNLGQPINTPGDDIYFALNPNSSYGYYASNRMGGYGDMDIYEVHYVSNETPECKSIDTLFVLNSTKDVTNDLSYSFSVNIPEQYKNKVKSISWNINGQTMAGSSDKLNYVFPNANSYKISAKAVVYCDTCPAFIALCNEKEIAVGQSVLVKQDIPKNSTPTAVTLSGGTLTNEQLVSLGWNIAPAYFEYDDYNLCVDACFILDQNIKVLKRNPDLLVEINGYADSRGSDSYNQELSMKRAQSVKRYLIQKGISGKRITDIVGYGESMIANGCDDNRPCTEEQHQINRKVDLKISNNNPFMTSLSVQ